MIPDTLDLFTDRPSPKPFHFDGETYEASKDCVRLNAQLRRVALLMSDGCWRTLAEIAAGTGDPEASISARLRDLTKHRFGASDKSRRRRGEDTRGLWEYRVVLSGETRRALANTEGKEG